MEKKLKLLLAEDDSDDIDLFRDVLLDLAPGIELIAVPDGKQVLDHLTRCGNESLPCAVVLDYNMPFLKAPEVLEWMRDRAWYQNIYKFVWSTSSEPEHIASCKEKGALEYFVKPASRSAMEEIVHGIVELCELSA